MNESLLSKTDQFEEDKDWFSELVGPDKKYKDDKALAKAVAHGQFHIGNIERENAEMRSELGKVLEDSKQRQTLQELIDQIKTQQTVTPNPSETSQQKAFDMDEIQTLIKKSTLETIQQSETSKRQSDNFNQVKNKLQEVYGNRYQDVLKKQLDDLGTSVEDFDDLAKTKPAVAIRALGLDRPAQEETFNAPPGTRERFAPTGQPKRTWSWYENLRKTDPSTYYKVQTQRQMEQDYRQLGKTFEDGEYRRFAPTYDI